MLLNKLIGLRDMRNVLYRILLIVIIVGAAIQQGCDGDPDLVEPVLPEVPTGVTPIPPVDIENLRMNELQAIGSHNSYRLRTYQPLLDYLIPLGSIQGNDPLELDYTHEALTTQFDTFNVRSIEIDLYNDPIGGAYYYRQGNNLISEPTASNEPDLLNSGMKVLHIIDVDYLTHHLNLFSALVTIRDWSNLHVNHLPLIVMIEAKETGIPLMTTPVPFNAVAFDALDAEVAAVFGANLGQVVTPDDFRGTYTTPNEAALAGAWPTLAASRGTIYFVLMLSAAQKSDYLSGHPALSGRTMFIFGDPGADETAFTKYDDPFANQDTIQSLVLSGYMVRTRADAGTWEARSGDYTRMDIAFTSGAQIISTDYYRPDERAPTDPDWSDYSVQLPNYVVARLNPVNGPVEYLGVTIAE